MYRTLQLSKDATNLINHVIVGLMQGTKKDEMFSFQQSDTEMRSGTKFVHQ